MSKSAHAHLLRVSENTNPRLHYVIQKHGAIHLSEPEETGIFRFLAKTLVGQQLSKSAAETIWARFSERAAELDISIRELCHQDNYEKIRNCGVSNNKTKALILLQQACYNAEISDEAILNASYEEIFELVTQLWGFGKWSADMVAMFYARLPDILPLNDVAVQRGLKLLVDFHTEESLYADFSPYRSYLSRHVWRALDSGLIGELTAE